MEIINCLLFSKEHYFGFYVIRENMRKSHCRREPLQECDFLHLLDSSGRLMDEHKLRRAVFEGGLSPEARKQAWQFLFELYPFHSTTSERVVQRLEQHARYRAMKSRWREVLHCDGDANELLFPDYLRNLTPQDEQSEYFSTGDKLSKEQLQMANTQAGIEAQRLVLDVEALKRDIRIIDKDVPRTDRDETYFQRETHMLWLRDVLITFCAMHPKTGYMQGMNDILARFLTVFDSEADAFWCLTRYIERMEADFTEEGILNKLGRARDLLGDLDNDLYEYLQHLQVADMAFCHSWLLLCFRRELSKDEGLRCFEIVSSHYLEVTSLRASSMFDDARRTGFEERGGGSHTSEAALCTELSLDVFMCITLLINNRNCLFECHDNADVFSQCNR